MPISVAKIITLIYRKMSDIIHLEDKKNFYYQAFITYKHSVKSTGHAVSLETALKRYAKPTLARPIKIFRDEKHAKPGIDLPKLIKDGLDNSEYLIFLAEKKAALSSWCLKELEYWCNILGRTEQLIIVLIDDDIVEQGTDGINWTATTALPLLLKDYITSIPFYVDLRWAITPVEQTLDNVEYNKKINSIVARFRNVAPEELNDEEIMVYRQNNRLKNVVITVLTILFLISISTSVLAVQSRNEAQRQLINFIQERINRQKKEVIDWERKKLVFRNAHRIDLVKEAKDSIDAIHIRIEADSMQLEDNL